MSETEGTESVVDIDDLDAFSNELFGQSKVEPDKTKPEAEQEKVDEKTEDTEAQTDEEDEAELDKPVDDKPKKKTVQDRINEVVRQREDQKREADAQMAALRAEIEALKKGTTPAAPATAAKEPTPDDLNDKGEPKYALGEFDPQYIRDLTRHTLNEERAKVEAETAQAQRTNAAQQEQQALTTAWNEKVVSATTEYPDFVEKGTTMLRQFDNLDQNYAGYLTQVLMSMEKGIDVLYYLSNHPDEAASIVSSGAQKATLALGRIESRFMQSEQEAPKPKVSKAPPPPTERARGTNGAFIAVSGDTEDLDQFSAEFFKKK